MVITGFHLIRSTHYLQIHTLLVDGGLVIIVAVLEHALGRIRARLNHRRRGHDGRLEAELWRVASRGHVRDLRERNVPLYQSAALGDSMAAVHGFSRLVVKVGVLCVQIGGLAIAFPSGVRAPLEYP